MIICIFLSDLVAFLDPACVAVTDGPNSYRILVSGQSATFVNLQLLYCEFNCLRILLCVHVRLSLVWPLQARCFLSTTFSCTCRCHSQGKLSFQVPRYLSPIRQQQQKRGVYRYW